MDSTVKLKLPLAKALYIADRFMKAISPHVLKAEIAGSVRRKCAEVKDIEIVCVENPLNPLSNLFVDGYKGMVLNGPRLKRFKYPDQGIQIELFITSTFDFGRILAIRTGSAWFSHIKLAVTWNRLGWCGTEDGLRRKKECMKKGGVWKIKPEYKDKPTLPPPFNTEEDFFRFLGLDWIPPEMRSWKDPTEIGKYSYL